DVADIEALQVEGAIREREGAVVSLLGAEHQLHRIGEEEGDTERADQRSDTGCITERSVRKALDRHTECGAARHPGQRDEDEEEPHGNNWVGGTTERVEGAEADERPDHEDVAVGEVEQLQDSVDERVAERDEGIGAALRQPVERELDELVHGAGRVYSRAPVGPDRAPGPPIALVLLDELVTAVRLDLEDVEPSVERVVRLRREAELTAEDPVLDPHVLDGADHGAPLHLAVSLCTRLLDGGEQDLDGTVGRRAE